MSNSRQPTHTRDRGDRGSVTVWVILGGLAMVLMVGLAVDGGGRVHAQQRAHDLTAQAARAGGERVEAAPAIEGRAVVIDPAAARVAARAYLTAAGVSGTVTITGGTTITVTVHDTYQTRILGMIGINRLHVIATATAQPVRTLGGTQR